MHIPRQFEALSCNWRTAAVEQCEIFSAC